MDALAAVSDKLSSDFFSCRKLKNWIAAQRRNAKRKGGQNNTTAGHPGQQGSAHHHTNGHHVPLPVVSTTAAQVDSEILKNMLGIGKPTSPQKDVPTTHSRDNSSSSSSARPSSNVVQIDTQNSSESLKALLGIAGGISPSPVVHSAPPPMATPASSGSEALKAMLGIPTSGSSHSLSQLDHTQAGSPFQARALANQSPRPLHQQALSPPSYHQSPNMSFAGSPLMGSPALANGRKSSMDLLALLNSGGNNNSSNGQSSNGLSGPRDVNNGASPLLAHFLQPRVDNGGSPATHGSNYRHGNGQGSWNNSASSNQFDYNASHGNTRPLSHSSVSSTSTARGTFPSGGANLNGAKNQRVKASSMQDFKFDVDALV